MEFKVSFAKQATEKAYLRVAKNSWFRLIQLMTQSVMNVYRVRASGFMQCNKHCQKKQQRKVCEQAREVTRRQQ